MRLPGWVGRRRAPNTPTHTTPTQPKHTRQVGKFYEIFHMDADVAVKELDLIYMKVRASRVRPSVPALVVWFSYTMFSTH